ncbi:MAG: RNA-directed DNA polymerase [Clostridia bacterium]|nr:RNA-directed DNA polymerase [Clostridia bacterium]
MYISYINKKNNQIETRDTSGPTEKNIQELGKRLQCFYYLYEEALKILQNGDVSSRYRTEDRLKKNKTRRRIDVPDEELMKYQKKVVDIFNNHLALVFPQSVYGYVKGRSPKAMAEVHRNQYQVIKMDIKDFFPNCTLDFIMKSMSTVYPFCLLDSELIETIIKPCMIFYDGQYRLPQGAPTSPILSNIAMIPVDYELESGALNGRGYNYTYTRFADDIIISHGEFDFSSSISAEERILSLIFGIEYEEPPKSLEEKYSEIKKITCNVINTIKDCLHNQNPNFKINSEKTKVLNTECGNVWMLGVTVGQDVKIGNQRKQGLKATLWTFLNDCKNGKPWSQKDTRHMLGILGYAKYIEPNFVNELIAKYEQKTGTSFRKEVKKILC